MAFASTELARGAGHSILLSAARAVIDRAAKSWRSRQVAAELHRLTDRELEDIGLERADISAVAQGRVPPRRG